MCVCLSLYIYIYKYICLCMYIYIYTYVIMYIYIYTYHYVWHTVCILYVNMYIHVYIYIYTRVYIHMYICIMYYAHLMLCFGTARKIPFPTNDQRHFFPGFPSFPRQLLAVEFCYLVWFDRSICIVDRKWAPKVDLRWFEKSNLHTDSYIF